MGRVSLTESYDDRSVIAKLNEMDKRVKENTTVVTSAEASAKASAQAAQETADRFAGSVGAVVQNANQQINASKAQVDQAKAEVDETVTTVAQAVQTANQASASAQESATTVATYDTRLTAVEDADTQNVKLSGDQNITGIKTVPTSATGTRNTQIANGTRIQNDLDAYEAMIRTTGNQTRSGVLKLTSNYPIRVNPVGGWGIIAVESDGIAPTGSRNYTPIQIDGVNGPLLKITHRSYQDNSSHLSLNFGRLDNNGTFRTDTLQIDSDALRTIVRLSRTKNDGTVVYATIAELTEASQ